MRGIGFLFETHLQISSLQIHHSIPFGITYTSFSTPHRERQMKQRLLFFSVVVKKWTIGKEYRGREKIVKWLVSDILSLLKQFPPNMVAFLM